MARAGRFPDSAPGVEVPRLGGRCRFGEAQAETLPHQRQWAQETAAAHGWKLARVIEGVSSGKSGPRRVRELLVELRALEARRPAEGAADDSRGSTWPRQHR